MANVTVNKTKSAAKVKTRKGFTLMEIIFVAIIIGVLAGMIVPKIIKNSELTQNSSALQSDAKTIYSSLKQYVTDDKYYRETGKLNAEELSAYVPSVISVEADPNDADTMILTDANYPNITYKIKPGSDAGTFDFTIDVTKAVNNDADLGKTISNKAAGIFANYCSTQTSYSGGQDSNGNWVGQVLGCQLK